MVENQPFAECPICQATATSLQLMPMHFDELDHAKKQATLTAVSDKRGKKRKNATLARLGALHPLPEIQEEQQLLLPPTANLATYYLSGTTNNTVTSSAGGSSAADSNTVTAVEESADSRTGRWTQEETDYCDSLIEFFEQGKLPIPEGLKLNEFLANMLKSKQARLTKKMKNAKLAARQYKRVEGYIASREEARAFSRLETEFFASIKCPMERSEIRFHMQKEWRDLFSSYCIAIGQSLDANAWLSSVEELDQRTSLQKDAARMVRRKVLLGHALSLDTSNSHSRGVYIKAAVPTSSQQPEGASTSTSTTSSMSNLPASAAVSQTSLTADPWERRNQDTTTSEKQLHRRELLQELAKQDHNPMKFYASPFIEKVTKLMKRLSIPFEHVDAWVPSFVSTDSEGAGNTTEQQVCRLCFAGCATVDDRILPEGGPPVPLTPNMKFDLLSFGEYSEKFSFDIGCGLPGRVYSSGVASWEQGIQNAPLAQFERSGGASQWGIQTVVGIPIPSPTAGRIVIVFYSTFDRSRNLTLVNRISEALTKVRNFMQDV